MPRPPPALSLSSATVIHCCSISGARPRAAAETVQHPQFLHVPGFDIAERVGIFHRVLRPRQQSLSAGDQPRIATLAQGHFAEFGQAALQCESSLGAADQSHVRRKRPARGAKCRQVQIDEVATARRRLVHENGDGLLQDRNQALQGARFGRRRGNCRGASLGKSWAKNSAVIRRARGSSAIAV